MNMKERKRRARNLKIALGAIADAHMICPTERERRMLLTAWGCISNVLLAIRDAAPELLEESSRRKEK